MIKFMLFMKYVCNYDCNVSRVCCFYFIFYEQIDQFEWSCMLLFTSGCSSSRFLSVIVKINTKLLIYFKWYKYYKVKSLSISSECNPAWRWRLYAAAEEWPATGTTNTQNKREVRKENQRSVFPWSSAAANPLFLVSFLSTDHWPLSAPQLWAHFNILVLFMCYCKPKKTEWKNVRNFPLIQYFQVYLQW